MPGNGVIITNCAKVTPAFSAISHRRIEGGGLVGRQAEDERAEHMHAMLLEGLQLLRQRLAGVVPVLEDSLQPFGRHRFNAHQRALDVGLAHGVQEVAVFARLHGDLGKEHHVLGQLGQLFHQLKTLVADRRQLFQLGELFCSRARRRSVNVTG